MKQELSLILIIPYQELLGNYDCICLDAVSGFIIPYQELLGNYDCVQSPVWARLIIPYQELLGNYDVFVLRFTVAHNYTIPRAIRELWLMKFTV